MAFYTELVLSNPIFNPKKIENQEDIKKINWNIHKFSTDTTEYKPNGMGIIVRYPLFRTNSNMYKYGAIPRINPSTQESEYDPADLRFPDLSEYTTGEEYLGRTESSHGSYVYVINEAQDHYTLHDFGSEPDKVRSDLEKNEPAETMTMVINQTDENRLQFNGFPRNVYMDGHAAFVKEILRTIEGPCHTARIFECIETHKGADKLLGYDTNMKIRDKGQDYKKDDEVIVSCKFIEQRIKITNVDDEGGVLDFELIGVKESGAEIENISGHNFRCNRNIDNILGDSTAFVDYGVSYPANHEYDDNTRDENMTGNGLTFNYDCEPVYDKLVNAFYDNEEYNRWTYIKDVYIYLKGDIVLAYDICPGYSKNKTINKYECIKNVIPLNDWHETKDSFNLISQVNATKTSHDLLWVKANDLLAELGVSDTLQTGSTYYLNNTSDTSYQYIITDDDPNRMPSVPGNVAMGATATAFSQIRVTLDGDLWLKIPFGHYLTINIEEVNE